MTTNNSNQVCWLQFKLEHKDSALVRHEPGRLRVISGISALMTITVVFAALCQTATHMAHTGLFLLQMLTLSVPPSCFSCFPVQELTEYEKVSHKLKITLKGARATHLCDSGFDMLAPNVTTVVNVPADLERDGFCKNPFFNGIIAEVPEHLKTNGGKRKPPYIYDLIFVVSPESPASTLTQRLHNITCFALYFSSSLFS